MESAVAQLMHKKAIAEMVRQLRRARLPGKPKNGLILANGGVATYQHVVCLSTEPRRSTTPYPASNPLPPSLEDESIPQVEENPVGEATVEVRSCTILEKSLGRLVVDADTTSSLQTYTVEFDRRGTPHRGHIVGRLGNGTRFLANHADDSTLMQLASTDVEPIGRKGFVEGDPTKKSRNLFSFRKTEVHL